MACSTSTEYKQLAPRGDISPRLARRNRIRSVTLMASRTETADFERPQRRLLIPMASSDVLMSSALFAPACSMPVEASVTKRVLDLCLIIALCVPALLLSLVFAVLIKLDSPGPIIYRQERIGQGGRRFLAWKFRTMVHDAETALCRYFQHRPELRQEWEQQRKLRCDPRVTRFGKVLRRTSLDELPQLWNVLKGEMSLVGPRPIVEEEMVRYDKYLSEYLAARPGITGLWQVSGRNDIGYKQRVALDVQYVRNWSVWLDIFILARTLSVVVEGKGAY